MDREKLDKTLKEHKAWLYGKGGIRADLRGADLRGAYLSGAYLSGAYLSGADLRGAYLSGADLRGAELDKNIVRSWCNPTYSAQYVNGFLTIGCQSYTTKQWSLFTEQQIRAMDGDRAFNFWKSWEFRHIMQAAEILDRELEVINDPQE